jgi:ankyrin repeat protein
MRLTYFINKQGSWNVPVGQTPLHFAVYFSVPWLAQMYISKNRSSVYATTATNDTPLIWASEMGSTECVKDLLDAGADPNEFEVDGWSALHWAARNGHLGVATLLLERGASLGQRDRRGHTPLNWAINREHWDVVSVLKRWSDKNALGRLDSTLQLQSMHATRYTRQLWDHRP